VKRFVLVIVLALVSNLVNASSWWMSEVVLASTASAHATEHEHCHPASHHSPSGSTPDQHLSLKCHACCPTFGFYAPHELTPQAPGCITAIPSAAVRAYSDITYTIDKPPKSDS